VLRLPPFRYAAPATANDAARLLADHGPDAMAVAGGTDLYPNMKRRQFTPRVLVGLRGLAEAYGIQANGALSLGAMATLTEVADHPVVRGRWPAIARAASLVSSPPLRNAGTIGGNLCVDTRCNYYNQTEFWRAAIGYCMKKDGHVCLVAPGSDVCWALSSSDTAPVMIALGADSPGLPLAYLERAIGALEGEDVDAVIGPADDGGYYLLGLRVCPRGALREIAWSTLRTRADTRASLDRHGLRVQEIDAFFDVDEIADLELLSAMLDRGEARAPKTARALAELRGAR